jgi:hypothetical protein
MVMLLRRSTQSKISVISVLVHVYTVCRHVWNILYMVCASLYLSNRVSCAGQL